MVITSGTIIPTALHLIGFGAKGPISGSFAAAIQRWIGTINAGSVFAQLQSAAMNGAAMGDIQKMATAAFTSLAIAGAAKLIGAGFKPFHQATDFERMEWKAWERQSRIDSTPELVNRMLHLWGPPTAEGCVAYGYREYRAPIWFVPKGSDPMSACLQMQASIQGVGFKTPLRCTNKGKNRVIGTWYVQSNETRCLPHWSEFEDEGCTQYGTRRMFSRLIGTRGQDDRNSICETAPAQLREQNFDQPIYCDDKGICETTPAQVREQNFDQPTYCDNKGILGIYGIFDMPDEKCECYCGRT
ncbi:hypothetical protein BDV93DRAFT_520244 [Ceratobasidium sp. AG-I]|nr:hypothetical protein BDV93DRAFT_520244 [Ceratobasidium sp. AG-I]